MSIENMEGWHESKSPASDRDTFMKAYLTVPARETMTPSDTFHRRRMYLPCQEIAIVVAQAGVVVRLTGVD